MGGLRAANKDETDGSLTAEKEREYPKIHHKHLNNLQLRRETDGKSEQMSGTDELTFFPL